MEQTEDIMSMEVIWPFLVRGRVERERGEELFLIFRMVKLPYLEQFPSLPAFSIGKFP